MKRKKKFYVWQVIASSLFADTIYVSNEKDNTISVIDSKTQIM